MTWVRIDDALWSHPKMLELPSGAVRLWLFALCWSGQQMSDGRVSHACVRLLGGKKTDVEKLVSAGLWDVAEDGFQIHDYLEYQTPRAKVQAEREAAKERMRRARSGEHSPNFAGSSPPRSHPIPSHTEQKEIPPVVPPPGDPPKRDKAPRQKPKTTLPADLEPLPRHRDAAQRAGVDMATELAKFRAHHESKGTLFRDWHRALDTWMINAAEFKRLGPAPGLLEHRARAPTQPLLRPRQSGKLEPALSPKEVAELAQRALLVSQ